MFREYVEIFKKLGEILNNRQKTWGGVLFVASIIAAVMETLGVSIIVPLVNVLLEPEKLWNKSYINLLASIFKINSDSELILAIVLLTICVFILKNLYFSFYAWLRIKYACKVQRECSIMVMKSYMSRGYSFFSEHNVSELMEGVNGDVALLYSIILNLTQSLSQTLIVLLICVYMCISDWQMAISIAVAAVLCLVLVYKIFRKIMINAGIERRNYDILSRKALMDAFYGIKEIMVMRKQKYCMGEYKKKITKSQNAHVRQTLGAEIPTYIIEAICISAILLVLCVKIPYVEDLQSFVAILASFAVGAFRVLPALGKISLSTNVISSSMVGMNSVYNNLVEAREFANSWHELDKKDSYVEGNKRFKNEVSIKNIYFRYAEELDDVLRDISLTIKKGESVGFIGETGAGKSTLADILLGIKIPQKGSIHMDNINVSDIPDLWSEVIGYVPQNTYLSDATIRENIAFAVDSQYIDDTKVKNALNRANILSFVEKLPKGLNTFIGEQGVRLSGGQCQRIAIARALYRQPEILVLDEATSALDNETERVVMEAMDSLHGVTTLVIIAHRISTVKNCDHIYEIKNGTLIERKYEELI